MEKKEMSQIVTNEKINKSDLYAVLNMQNDAMFFEWEAYKIIKKAINNIELDDETYEIFLEIIFLIFNQSTKKQEILNDILTLSPANTSEYTFFNIIMETIISRVESGKNEIFEYYVFLEGMFLNMTNSLYRSVFVEEYENDLMNAKLDFLILVLKLTQIYVENCVKNGLEIENKEIFLFAREYFHETIFLLTSNNSLEDDAVFVFKSSCAIDALVTRRMFGRITEIFSIVSDFSITSVNLKRIYIQIIDICRYSPDDFGELLTVFFTTECLTVLEINLKTEIIEKLIMVIKKSYSSYAFSIVINETIQRIFHFLREMDGENKDFFIHTFLSFASKLILRDDSSVINNVFLRFAAKNITYVEPYCEFILNNKYAINLKGNQNKINLGFIKNFYSALFRNAKKEEKCTEYIDKVIIDFLNFFLSIKNKELIGVLPLIPYIPTKRESFHALYEIYTFLFENDCIDCITLFLLKTPALVGVASNLYYDVRYLPHLAVKLDLLDLSPQKLIFLGIIYYCESKKINNFDYTGILKYIEDMDTIRIGRHGLLKIIEMIHLGYISRSYEHTLMYLNDVFNIALKHKTVETTLIIISVIIKCLLEKEEMILFNKNIHIKFQNLFDLLRKKNFLSSDVMEEYVKLYSNILLKIKKAPNFYNYVVFCIADLSFFDNNFDTVRFKSFNEFHTFTISKMKMIEEFPEYFINSQVEENQSNDFKSENDEINIELLNKGVNVHSNSVSWLIDVIYTRRTESTIIRTVLNLLKLRLETKFEYEDLYILLKAYNILFIRENDSDVFLKQILQRGIDFKVDTEVCRKLSLETTGLYRFFFNSLYSIISNNFIGSDVPFPEKNELKSNFDIPHLIVIQNAYIEPVVAKILKNYNTPCYLDYFFNIHDLSVLDCLTIIKRLRNKKVVEVAFNRLKEYNDDVFFYIPQLVQTILNNEYYNDIIAAIIDLAKDELIAHQLIWNLKANLYSESSYENNCNNGKLKQVIGIILDRMTYEEKDWFEKESSFIDLLTKICSDLMPFQKASKDEKRRRINEYLDGIKIHPGTYIPYNPDLRVIEIVKGSARVLQSHAKIPFMASFKIMDSNGHFGVKQLIFKAGDDCRQDMLALQIITMFDNIFRQANLDIFLYSYKVIATGAGCGIIEVVSNSKSRDQIGRENINNLCEYFEYKFGFKESEGYITALNNFASSLAGYSLIVYFLNIKDRHNGNILIDDKGRMVHIDFGYMLEISPGNLNIEAPLKLTKEIEDLLGGHNGKGFKIYQDLMVKGFLALRRRSKDLILVLDSFVESGLPCYRKNALENFISRFRFELSDKHASRFIISLIAESSQKLRTWIYDQYQKFTNDISF